MIQRPPPYDASPYAPTGQLSAAERAWTARLYHPHHLALAWRLLGRDADGNLVAGTIVSCGRDTAHQRHCYMTFTAAGVVHRDAIVPIDAARTTPARSRATRERAAGPTGRERANARSPF